MKTFDFYFDFGSLASYLAHTQLPKMCTETGASANLRPMLLGGVFQATGNASPMTVPAKGRYVFVDFKRFANGYGVPLNMNPHFPIITTTLMRMVTALQMNSDPRMRTFMDAVYRLRLDRAQPRSEPFVVRARPSEPPLAATLQISF